MKSAKDILEEEVQLLIEDIIAVYEASGKKVTGKFAKDLTYKVSENKVELWGQQYLAGRPAGKISTAMVKNIEKWVIDRGIASLPQASGIAWAITKKIGEKGTRDDSHLPIYEQVLNAQRIDSIIKKVSSFHAQRFVEDITVQLMMITQKYEK